MAERLKEFKYTKAPGDSSIRSVIVYTDTTEFIEGIDLGHLSVPEQTEVKELVRKFEAALQPFVSKAWRRFKKSLIS